MKRELASEVEAGSQFNCVAGRTRSSKNSPTQFTDGDRKNKKPPSVDRSVKSIEEVCVNRRNKRVKNEIPVADSVIADQFNVSEVPAAVAEVVNAGEESAANDVLTITPKRFTRSALVEKKESPEEFGDPTRNNLELKMSKKIGLGRTTINLRKLLETGLLEGLRVYYDFNTEGKNLQGIIKGGGILCSCSLCLGTKVIATSQFEMHACLQYRHAIKHIRLENGKSLLEVIEICKASDSDSTEVALKTVISSLPVNEPSTCTKCDGLIEASGTGNLLVCDSCVNKKQVEAELRVVTRARVRASSSDPKASAENLLVCDSRVNKKQVEGEPSVATRGQVRAPSQDPEAFESNTSESNILSISSDKKRKRGRPRKSSNSALKPVKSPGKFKVAANKRSSKILERSSPRSASVPGSIKSSTKCTSSQQQSGTKLTIKNLQLHCSVFQEGGLPNGTVLTYVVRGKKCLDGYKSGSGIFCSCCSTVISPSLFEAHAGSASRKKPYEHIYISNGVSLHEYAVSLKKLEKRTHPVKYNDNACGVCRDGGDLLLCDGCPRSFHQECIGKPSIPRGKWYCRYCQQSSKVGGESANALAAGRVAGVDPMEQIMTRCIRIVNPSENTDYGVCVLCRDHDFSKSGFNDRTVIVCDQCEKEYHIGCLRKYNMADLKTLPKEEWFCRNDCERINSLLKNLLMREPETLPDDMLTLLREKQRKNNNHNSETDSISEMKFVVLRGKSAPPETKKLLAQTVNIFHEGFDPIIDETSGRDFIHSMVYGRKILSQDFAGMLCAMLTIDSKVVSAGTLRVFGEDIAELPIVATSKSNQGKGYFQVLFTCIEKLLSSLKVKKIVLPAADEAKSIWTEKFGFETIAPDQLNELRGSCSAVMAFHGTSMLQKEVDGVADAGHGSVNPVVE